MEGTSIAVLCMNKPGILRVTLQELRRTLVHPYEVIVIDNGSTDPATLELLAEHENLPDWTVVHNPENVGLSKGTNQGLALGKYDCLIHMDDDCVIHQPGWNQTMRGYFQHTPKIGMIAPNDYSEGIRRGAYRELRWALGMVWAIRKELFDDIGGYDPQLLHQNECDMALRVRMAGYHLAGIADFTARHNDPGGPSSQMAEARLKLGCYQFRDKWASYFKGRDWNGGTQPIYLMQHFPPDAEFYRQLALQERRDILELAPPPTIEPTELHADDRALAIATWLELTGEQYAGYVWGHNLLKPLD